MAQEHHPREHVEKFFGIDNSNSFPCDTPLIPEESSPDEAREARSHVPETQRKKQKVLYECAPCKVVYTERRTLVRHYTTPDHRRKVGALPASHVCSYCRKPFTRDDLRKRHQREVHLQIKRRRQQQQQDLTTFVQSPDNDAQRLESSPPTERSGSVPSPSKDTSAPLTYFHELEDTSPWTRFAELEDSSLATGFAALEAVRPFIERINRESASSHWSGSDPAAQCDTATRWRILAELEHASPWTASAELEDTSPHPQHIKATPQSPETLTAMRSKTAEQASATDSGLPSSVKTPSKQSRSTSMNDSGCDMSPPGHRVTRTRTGGSQDADSGSIGAASTIHSMKRRFERAGTALNHSRILLQKSGASLRPSVSRKRVCCVLCNSPFGRTAEDVRAHLHTHFLEFASQYPCSECRIAFPRKADLRWHQSCAEQGHCGFDFGHTEPCQGHHPPCSTLDFLSDNDRMRLCIGLRTWEQTQLHSYMSDVDTLLSELPPTSDDRWSVGAICRKSMHSISARLSRIDLDSAPSHLGPSSRAATGTTQEGLSKMGTRTLYRSSRQASRAYRIVAPRGESNSQLDGLLSLAASCGNLTEVKRLLWAGASVNGRNSLYAATPATLALVNGHTDTMSLIFDYGGSLSQPVFCDRDLRSLRDPGDLRAAHYRHDRFLLSKDPGVVTSWIGSRDFGGPSYSGACNCVVAVGRDNDDEDFARVPSSIVKDFDIEHLAKGIGLCYAIECGFSEIALRLCQIVPPGRSAIAVRLAADQNRHELLAAMLIYSAAAASAVKADSSILRSAAFGMCEGSVDVLLQHSSNHDTKTVLRDAVTRSRADVVRMLCAKTIAFVDPLDRTFDCRLPFHSTHVELNTVRQMLNHSSWTGKVMDYARVYLLLATAVPGQQSDIVNLLHSVGVERDTTSAALCAISNFDSSLRRLDSRCDNEASAYTAVDDEQARAFLTAF